VTHAVVEQVLGGEIGIHVDEHALSRLPQWLVTA
jgi:hypothetical protein